MERRAEDLVALIGRPSSDAEKVRDRIFDEVPFQSTVTASTTASDAVDPAPGSSENGQCPSTGSAGSTVHTVVVDVERPPVDDQQTDFNEDEQRTEPLSGLSRMRRSEACYDIAHISSSSPVNVPDSLCRRVSSNSSPRATSPTSAETKQNDDLFSEEEKALKCLDAIAFEYADHDVQEPIDRDLGASHL